MITRLVVYSHTQVVARKSRMSVEKKRSNLSRGFQEGEEEAWNNAAKMCKEELLLEKERDCSAMDAETERAAQIKRTLEEEEGAGPAPAAAGPSPRPDPTPSNAAWSVRLAARCCPPDDPAPGPCAPSMG